MIDRPVHHGDRVYIDGNWKVGIPWSAGRDPYWVFALKLARAAVEGAGHKCIACGSFLWSRANTGRLYCDEVCRKRHYARRGRYRTFLREHDQPCQLCGCHPDDVSPSVHETAVQGGEPLGRTGTDG